MSNVSKIKKSLSDKGLPALLLTDGLDMRYATGFFAEGSVIVFPEEAFLITDSRYIEAAKEAVKGVEVLMSSVESSETAILKGLLEERGVSVLGVQDESLSYAAYLRLREKLGVEFVPAQDLTIKLRQAKEPWEVQCIETAQRIAEKALDFVLGFIKEGLTEKEVAAELEYQMAKNGSQGLAFETICVSGENSSRPHGVPTDRRLRKGDFITMDFGCKIDGYCSDMTRTVALGPISDEMRRVYETVLEAQLAGIAAARAGIPGRDVDKAARDVIEKAGYGEFFGHGLGHSVGLLIHEGPNTNPREERILPVGAVITSEPGIYLPGRFGVRIEDMLLLTEKGCRNLTKAPKNLIIL